MGCPRMLEAQDIIPPLVGGGLIGVASALLLVLSGRIAGISGIVDGIVHRVPGETAWRLAFVLGLALSGAVMALFVPQSFPAAAFDDWGVLAAAGILVGFGSRLGSGCTSGHGVCGIGRLSLRGLTATLTFMATGTATVFLWRHLG